MSVLFTFPGQGAQRADVLHGITGPDTRQLIDDIGDILGENVFTLDTEQALNINRNIQLVLTICALICTHRLELREIRPDYVLGLSIGAFPAAIASGALTLEDGIRAVATRGRLMTAAYPDGYGMAAITGLTTQQVLAVIEQESTPESPLYLANINTEYQNIVSGSLVALAALEKVVFCQQASGFQLLKVNVPSHCPLMATQAKELLETMKKVPTSQPRCAYVSANRARVITEPSKIREDLAMNMATQVHWWETTEMLSQRGVKLAVEMYPGNTLTRLSRVSMKETLCISCEETTIGSIEKLVGRITVTSF